MKLRFLLSFIFFGLMSIVGCVNCLEINSLKSYWIVVFVIGYIGVIVTELRLEADENRSLISEARE